METGLDVLEIIRTKANEAFDEIIERLRRDEMEGTAQAGRSSGSHGMVWSLGETTLSGEWEFVRKEQGVAYVWPDKSVSEFDRFDIYRGNSGFTGITIALGYEPNGNVVGFVLGGGGGSKRGLTVFFPADDFSTSNEKVSMIRGGGQRGRSGFAPGDALPPAYASYKTDVLRSRVAGKWNVQAIVADAADVATMAAHTAIQARLRGLV
ncbi:MAG TPA: hypothetical protein VFA19_07095 [Gaiellaceae bacterium]|nr:hypothetical protein [Gaiellaceae bacterium]